MGRVRAGPGALPLSLAVGRIRRCRRVRGCSPHRLDPAAHVREFGDELPVVGGGEDDSAQDETGDAERV